MSVPVHLQPYASIYERDPHEAALTWFEEAGRGLFIHYGLYSLLGRGEWVLYEDAIPLDEYAGLADRFTAERFEPQRLADLAVSAGMRYINLVVKHHDGFALYDSAVSDFNSQKSAARRDLVAEFAQACRERGLGLFLYYSYGVDWRHPYSMPRELYECARPGYTDMSHYRYRQPEDFKHFVDDMHTQLRELLTGYGPVAGVWFDLISACYFCPEFFPVADTYALIRSLQPHALISFKQGFTGDEDFLAQEVHFVPISERLKGAGASPEAVARSEWAWQTLLAKRRRHEVCLALQSRRWAWIEGVSHRSKHEVAAALTEAQKNRCNLLLNVGPRPDGSLESVDEDVLARMADQDFASNPETDAGSCADTQAAQQPDIPA